MAIIPSRKFLDKTILDLQKKFDASREIVESLIPDWDKWEQMYKHNITTRERSYESNLILPKPYYVIETLTPQILGTIFNAAEYLTAKNPDMDEQSLRQFNKWFCWFLLKRMSFYIRTMEQLKGSPMYGTSFLKTFLRNGHPALNYVRPHDFFPDPKCTIPGGVDMMGWCFHRIRSVDLGQLERATVPRLQIARDEIDRPIMNESGEPVTQVIEDAMYFHLDRVWEKYIKDNKTEMPGPDIQVDVPSLTLLEYWGEIETTFGTYDINRKRYQPGKYEEYVVTSILEGDKIEEIIRCEPSTFSYVDPYEGLRYLKPFVPSLYTITPGEFYGQGAIQPIESIVQERKDHHDLYMDEHKRSLMSILKVIERSGLTKDDLEMRPYNIWYMRNHDDVEVVKFPEVNLQAFNSIDALLDREADRTLAMSALSQGVAASKRQTFGEVRMLMSEQIKRQNTFIQMTDHITLRPLAFKVMILMRQMPQIIRGEPFYMPDGDVKIDPEMLTDRTHISFAATGVEPESSRYMKADLWPRLLKGIAELVSTAGGKYQLKIPEILEEFENLYDIKDPQRFVEEARPMIPIDTLMQATPPEYQQAMATVVQQAGAMLQAEQEMAKEQR